MSLASFNKLSKNISSAFDMINGTDEPILPTSSSDCMIRLILEGEKRASYFFLLVGIIEAFDVELLLPELSSKLLL